MHFYNLWTFSLLDEHYFGINIKMRLVHFNKGTKQEYNLKHEQSNSIMQ